MSTAPVSSGTRRPRALKSATAPATIAERRRAAQTAAVIDCGSRVLTDERGRVLPSHAIATLCRDVAVFVAEHAAGWQFVPNMGEDAGLVLLVDAVTDEDSATGISIAVKAQVAGRFPDTKHHAPLACPCDCKHGRITDFG